METQVCGAAARRVAMFGVASLVMKRIPETVAQGERTYIPRQELSYSDLASEWETSARKVREALNGLSIPAHFLFPANEFPDSHCVYDVCLRFISEDGRRIAIAARMGPESRRGEVECFRRSFVDGIMWHEWHELPKGRMEFGDAILVPGRRLCLLGARQNDAGLCVRSDDDGREGLRECLLRFGIESLIVPFDGSRENGRLHLTTAMSFVGMVEGVPTLLINPRAVRCVELLRSFGFRVLETPQGEEWAANALYLGKRLIFPQGYPLTKELLSNAGIRGLIFASFSLIGATETSPTCLTNLEVDPF